MILLRTYKLRGNKNNPSGQRSGFPLSVTILFSNKDFFIARSRIGLLCSRQTFHGITTVFSLCCGSLCCGSLCGSLDHWVVVFCDVVHCVVVHVLRFAA